METKKGRIKNDYGQVILTTDELCELLLSGKSIDRTVVDESEDFKKYKEHCTQLLENPPEIISSRSINITVDEFHERSCDRWLIPVEYQQIDVIKWLTDKCNTQEQLDRVTQEYQLYEERNLVMLLRLFIYLVDYMRKNGFVWGVGRGSSVSSYILFLIGVHRVDSLFYQLDIREYLK